MSTSIFGTGSTTPMSIRTRQQHWDQTSRKVPVNALTSQVRTGTNLSGLPTNRDLTGFLLSERGRVNHTSTPLKTGEILIAGGSNGCRPDAADDPPWDPLFVELYNMTSGSFQLGGNMSTTRIGHAAIRLADGEVLMLGGIPAVQNVHEQLQDLPTQKTTTPQQTVSHPLRASRSLKRDIPLRSSQAEKF
jgi:hypothetical protein